MNARAGLRPGVTSPASNGAAPAAPDLPPPAVAYAGLATRVIAFVIDILIIQAVTWIVGAVAAVIASMLRLSDGLETALVAAGAVVATLWAVSYFTFFWVTTGQTPGNRLLQIRVLDAGGSTLPLGRALVRVPAAVLSALILFVGYLTILVDSQRRALHDRLLRSVVIDAPEPGRRRRARPAP
jgi:uncharacterized RDD family membrane protein YckC